MTREDCPLFHATAGEHGAYVTALLCTPVPSAADITAAAEGVCDG